MPELLASRSLQNSLCQRPPLYTNFWTTWDKDWLRAEWIYNHSSIEAMTNVSACHSVASCTSSYLRPLSRPQSAFGVTPIRPPQKVEVSNVASILAVWKFTSILKKWCSEDKQNMDMVTDFHHQRVFRHYLIVIWATPSSAEAALFWLCLTAATRPKMASLIVGVHRRIYAIHRHRYTKITQPFKASSCHFIWPLCGS